MLLVQSYGTNGTLYKLPALSYGYGYSPIQNYPTGYRTQREPRTLLVPQPVQLARASASALPRPGHGPQHLQKGSLDERGHRQGGEEKCGGCKMGRLQTCRGFSPAVTQKKVQKVGEATRRAATPALIMRGYIPRRANWPQPTRYPVEQRWGHEWRCQQRWSYWLAPTEGALQPPHRGRMPRPTPSGIPRRRTARQGASWGPQA